MDSTLNCRANGSLFDVSHMCGLSLHGSQDIPFLESLVVADVAALKDGTGSLTIFTNDKGGAIDDSVITKVTDNHIYLVVNAGCSDKDLAHIGKHVEAFRTMSEMKDTNVVGHSEPTKVKILPCPQLSNSDSGEEGVLNTLWQKYENAIDKR